MRPVAMTLAILAILGGAACEPAEAPADQTSNPGNPRPGETMAESFAGCEWGEVTGSGLSVWSYACGPEAGHVRLVADDSLPGFAIETTADGQTTRQPAIVMFDKPADARLESIVQAVRAKSPGPWTATCTLQPVTAEGVAPGRYGFEPTGEARAAWAAFVSGESDAEPLEPPCGAMGPQMAGDRTFRVIEGDPATVVFIDHGSEIQIFDPATLRPAA